MFFDYVTFAVGAIFFAVKAIFAVGAILYLLVVLASPFGFVIYGLLELDGYIYRRRHPPRHPSTIPGLKYDPERRGWVHKDGRLYGCAYTPSKA
jgi:hypothetical protein